MVSSSPGSYLEFVSKIHVPSGAGRRFRKSRLVVLTELLHPYMLAELFTTPREHGAEFARRDYFRQRILRRGVANRETGEPEVLVEFTEFAAQSMDGSWDHWRDGLGPWKQLVDRGYKVAPGGRLFSALALISTAVSVGTESTKSLHTRTADEPPGVVGEQETVHWSEGGFSPSSPLKKALLTGFHSTAKHNATKAVSPSSETMRTI